MLTRARPLLALARTRAPRAPLARPFHRQAFLQKLDREIADSLGQIVIEDPHNEEYFRRQGWGIAYRPSSGLYCFSREAGGREVRVLVHVQEDPPNTQEHSPDSEQPSPSLERDRLDFSQVGIYVRRKGGARWLTVEMAVMEGAVEMMGAFFTTGEPDFGWEKGMYGGPELKTLPEGVVGAVQWVLGEAGVNSEVLMNMVILASNKVDQIDLQWLQDLRALWA